jgi:hypothetical protein
MVEPNATSGASSASRDSILGASYVVSTERSVPGSGLVQGRTGHTDTVTKLTSVAVLVASGVAAVRVVHIAGELRERWEVVEPVPVPNAPRR